MRTWANGIAMLGLVLGSLSGLVITNLAWEHNPQNTYGHNPYQILWVFYGWLTLVALPFVILRHAMLFRSKVLGIGTLLALMLMGILVQGKVIEIGEFNYNQKLLGLFAMLYAIPHILDLTVAMRGRIKGNRAS